MDLLDLNVYRRSMDFAEEVWGLSKKWDLFSKNTLGKQMVRSADSIAANISEGFGRYHYKEKKLFCYYARGSLFETRTWHIKAHRRGLIDNVSFDVLEQEMTSIGKMLNRFIASLKPQK